MSAESLLPSYTKLQKNIFKNEENHVEKVCFTFKWIFTLLSPFFRHYNTTCLKVVFCISKAIHSVNDFHCVYFHVFILKLFFDNLPAQEALCQPPSKCWPLPSSCGRVSLVLLQNHALTEDKDNNEEKVLP